MLLVKRYENSCKFSQFQEFTGIGALYLLKHYYNNSPSLLITSLYPEYQLLPWKFTWCPHNYWSSLDNQRKFLDWAGKQLGIKEPNDWYSVGQKV
jgi:hypothetical protein